MRHTDRPDQPRDLRPLFAPRSVAVVGASADTSKWAGDIAARLAARPRTLTTTGRG